MNDVETGFLSQLPRAQEHSGKQIYSVFSSTILVLVGWLEIRYTTGEAL